MTEFAKVTTLEELPPGSMKKFPINGTDVLLVNANGHLYGVSTVCTHDGGDLADGTLQDTTITCPLHGSMFEVTNGEVVVPPAEDSLKIFQVKVEGNDVLVKTD